MSTVPAGTPCTVAALPWVKAPGAIDNGTSATSLAHASCVAYMVAWYERYVLKPHAAELLWEKCRDENNERYYHNKETGVTQREKPEDADALLI